MAPNLLGDMTTSVVKFPTLVAARSISSDVGDVKTTFSSWDNCMQESYCKYPVIIAIVVVSLIALSVLFCVVRCLCCGLECCCGMCACCNACCSCCQPSRRDRTQYRDAPPQQGFQPSPYQGYQPTPAPFYNAPTQPQFAHFDAGKKSYANEDALPAMPSWETASTRRVLDDSHHDEGMELGRIDHADEAKAPMLANQAPSPHSGYESHTAAYSDSMPYQQRIAQNGGDLGAYGHNPPPPSYRTHSPASGVASAPRSPQGAPQSFGNQPSRPTLQPGYSSYGSPSPSAQQNYAPSHQGYSAPQQNYGAPQQSQGYSGQQPYQSYQSHQPTQGSWRDV